MPLGASTYKNLVACVARVAGYGNILTLKETEGSDLSLWTKEGVCSN